MCCFHALEHYSQHFSKKRNLVCTPFTMCNCPNWIRTNITRVKFLRANLYTIEQCVGCEFILYDGRIHSLRATINQDTSLYHACVLMTLTPVNFVHSSKSIVPSLERGMIKLSMCFPHFGHAQGSKHENIL